MAHAVETMFSAERPSWHRHNDTFVLQKVTAKDALRLSDTAWQVGKFPLYAKVNEELFSPVPADDVWGIVRLSDNKVLGSVGSRYTPIQNEFTAQFAADIVDSGEALFVTGGALDGGKVVWYCLEVPKEIKIGGVDSETIKLYLSTINTHTGKGSFKAIVSPTRIECQNTMALALKDSRGTYSVRHTKNAEIRLQQAREALQMSFEYADVFQAEANEMLSKHASVKTFDKAYARVWPEPDPEDQTLGKGTARWHNRRDQILWVWQNSPNLGNIRETHWGVFNAFSEWAQWGRPYRGTGGDEAKQDDLAVKEVLMGQTRDYVQSAFDAVRTLPSVKVVSTKTRKKVTAGR